MRSPTLPLPSETTPLAAPATPRPTGWKWTRRISFIFLLGIILLLLPVRPAPVMKQHHPPQGAESMTVEAGAQYHAGPVYGFLMGDHYRQLWTEPIKVPILNLERFEGGLRAVREGGGMQTRTLHLTSGWGHHFVFRSVDKELTRLAPPGLGRSPIVGVLQDQASASHPASVLVAAQLQAAAGLPHPNPRFVLLPDDTLLGPFRGRYAGLFGVLQESPSEISLPHQSSDSVDVRNTVEVLPLVEASPTQQIDARAFLTARLLDLFLNDWDRHEGQWRWAASRLGSDTVWQPIPVDRDQAFAWYDGVVMRMARLGIGKLVQFGPEPNLSSLTINSVRLDGRLLGGLSRPVWDSTAAWLASRLTDSVIEAAVHQMPDPYWRLSGEALASTLKQRRDRLPRVAQRFYLMLAQRAEVHGTAKPDRVEITFLPADSVAVEMSPILPGGNTGQPRFARRYAAGETREITISLHGGRDRVVTPVLRRSAIRVNLIDQEGHTIPWSRLHPDSTELGS